MKKKKRCARGRGVANGHMIVGGGGGGGGRCRPATLGPSGQPFWACPARHPWGGVQACHSGPVGSAILGLSGPSPLGLFGPPPGPVRLA